MSFAMNDPLPQIVQCSCCGIKAFKHAWDSRVPPSCPRCGNSSYADYTPKAIEKQVLERDAFARKEGSAHEL